VKAYMCKLCEKIFYSECALRGHLRYKHRIREKIDEIDAYYYVVIV